MLVITLLAKLPFMSANALCVGGHRLVCAARLHLVVARLVRLALGALQNALILRLELRLGKLNVNFPLTNALLSLSLRAFWPHLTWCQRLEVFTLDAVHQVGVLLDVKQNTHEPVPVPTPEQLVFPRRLLIVISTLDCILPPLCMLYRPVVDCNLSMLCLDWFSGENLLKLLTGVFAERVIGRHGETIWVTIQACTSLEFLRRVSYSVLARLREFLLRELTATRAG